MKTGIIFVGRELENETAKSRAKGEAQQKHQKDGIVQCERYNPTTGNVTYRVLGTLENRKLSAEVKTNQEGTAYDKAKFIATTWLAAGHLVTTQFSQSMLKATVRAK